MVLRNSIVVGFKGALTALKNMIAPFGGHNEILQLYTQLSCGLSFIYFSSIQVFFRYHNLF